MQTQRTSKLNHPNHSPNVHLNRTRSSRRIAMMSGFPRRNFGAPSGKSLDPLEPGLHPDGVRSSSPANRPPPPRMFVVETPPVARDSSPPESSEVPGRCDPPRCPSPAASAMLLEEIVEEDCSEPSSDWAKETPSAGGDDYFEDNKNYLPAGICSRTASFRRSNGASRRNKERHEVRGVRANERRRQSDASHFLKTPHPRTA